MAFKKYGYYLKGNKIAVIEQSDATSSGNLAVAHCTVDPTNNTTKDTCEAAGGQWIPSSSGSLSSYSEYMSPTESVADGLEIQYAYSPTYTITTSATTQVNKFYVNGWTVKDGYLTFLRSYSAAVANWDTAPESAIGDGEYIVVNGSEKWNGLHKVKAGGTDGTLQTYTRINKSVPVAVGSSSIDIAGESSSKSLISANDASDLWLNSLFSAGDYIFVTGSAEARNNGFWKVDSVADDASSESSSGLYVVNRYYLSVQSDFESEDTTVNTTATTDESVTIYKAYRDFCSLQGDVDVLNDESDELDLSRYQANALVYYLKAKLAEDAGDIEMREFFMREFKRQLEKSTSALKRGPYMIQGFKEMR